MSSHTYDSCKVLVRKNANVNKQDNAGNTPLHLAAWNGYHNICKLLVENNANINQPNNKGKTPLHLAADERHRRCYILLGGDASELDSESESDESEVSGSHSSWDSDDS